jgi:hypothetical protein
MNIAAIASVIGADMTLETLADIFELSASDVDELIREADKKDCLQSKQNTLHFCMCADKIHDLKLTALSFQKPLFRYLTVRNAKQLKGELPAIVERLADGGISNSEIVVMLIEMGNMAKLAHYMDHALELYDRSAV